MAGEKRGKLGADTEVSIAEFSSLIGLTADRVYQLIRNGTLQTVRRGHLLLADSLQQYIKYRTADTTDEEDFQIERDRRRAEASLKTSKAAIAKMEADELKGKMHRSEDVAAMTEDLVYTIRGSLLALPGRLAVDVAAVKTAAEAAEVIRKEVYAIMRELSNYRYDPKKYEERVRERQKWEASENYVAEEIYQ